MVTFATFSSEEPPASSTAFRFSHTWRVSALMPPSASRPVFGSKPSWPEAKTQSPTLIACESGTRAGGTLSVWTTLRSMRSSRRRMANGGWRKEIPAMRVTRHLSPVTRHASVHKHPSGLSRRDDPLLQKPSYGFFGVGSGDGVVAGGVGEAGGVVVGGGLGGVDGSCLLMPPLGGEPGDLPLSPPMRSHPAMPSASVPVAARIIKRNKVLDLPDVIASPYCRERRPPILKL